MPGVSLDFLPASEAPKALGSPDSACAESGLEEMIGDLLAQEEVQEEEQEHFCKRKFELMLRCAVGEIHCDLQAFGKRVDARLVEAAAQVAPLAEAFAKLQEENMRLRIQQEMLVRQVEALCQMMGLADPSLHVLPWMELSEIKTPSSNFPLSSSDFQTLPSDPPTCAPQGTTLEKPCDTSSCTPQDSPSSLPQETSAGALCSQNIPSSIHQEPISCPQDSDSVSIETNKLKNSEPSPVPHPPTFATRRSLSAPSLMANTPCNDSMVPLSVNGSDHNPFNSDKPPKEKCLLYHCCQCLCISWQCILRVMPVFWSHTWWYCFIAVNIIGFNLALCPHFIQPKLDHLGWQIVFMWRTSLQSVCSSPSPTAYVSDHALTSTHCASVC